MIIVQHFLWNFSFMALHNIKSYNVTMFRGSLYDSILYRASEIRMDTSDQRFPAFSVLPGWET
jgi:hypothetical protein